MQGILKAAFQLLQSMFRPPYTNLIIIGAAFLVIALLMKLLMGTANLTSRSAKICFDILFIYIFGFLSYGMNGTLNKLIRYLPFWDELMKSEPIRSMTGDQLIPLSSEITKLLFLALIASIVGTLVEKNVRDGKFFTAFITTTLWKVVIVFTGLFTCMAVDYMFARYLKTGSLKWTPVYFIILMGVLMFLLFLKIIGFAAFLAGAVFGKIFGFFTGHIIGRTISSSFAACIFSTLMLMAIQARGIAAIFTSGKMTLTGSWPSVLVVLFISFMVERFL